jgi:hypothetical protein
MKKFVFSIFFVAVFLTGCATTNQHALKIESAPPDALISVHDKKEPSTENTRKVAGTTPIEKNFDFPAEGNRLWLEIEKRGYIPQWVKVTPETKALTVKLERMKDKNGALVKEYTFPLVKRLLFVTPDFEVVERGFSSEGVSKDKSAAAKVSLTKGTQAYFTGKYEVMQIQDSQDDAQLLKSVWRDVRAAMELIDPIRLKYLLTPQYLETKSSREAARQLGSRYGGEVLLLLSGRQNLETAGMVLGKIGISAAGTLASYGSAYNNAVARGDSFFIYTIYTPDFAQGTLVKAALIDCATSEILWINKGTWGVIQFDNPGEIKSLTTDLFAGLK